MKFTRQLKNAFKHLLAASGYEIYKRPYLPKGTDVFESLRAHWPQWQPRVIFDVGANVGQTIGRLRPLFPAAEIHAFEPDHVLRLAGQCARGHTSPQSLRGPRRPRRRNPDAAP